jgi:hypothetical protein
LYLKDIGTLKTGSETEFVQIRRDCKLTSLTVSDDGLSAAIGDESGKIYNITNPKGSSSLIIQTLHWHAQKVNYL